MNKTHSVSEQFDLNEVTVAGVVQKLWGRSADVYARLRISQRGVLVEPEDALACYVTLRFADGRVGGDPITLQPGAALRVGGYLTHNWIDESLRKFLDGARASDFLESVPEDDLGAWRKISFRRSSAVLNVLVMTVLHVEAEGVEINQQEATAPNQATLEGIVAKQWQYQRDGGVTDLFARLAVYDAHTHVSEVEGNFGRPRRSPHYINVLFPEGKVAGHSIRLADKTRLRVSGQLRDLGQRVTLHDALIRTGRTSVAELINRLPGAECLHEIMTHWDGLHLRAEAAIIYTAGRPRKKK